MPPNDLKDPAGLTWRELWPGAVILVVLVLAVGAAYCYAVTN